MKRFSLRNRCVRNNNQWGKSGRAPVRQAVRSLTMCLLKPSRNHKTDEYLARTDGRIIKSAWHCENVVNPVHSNTMLGIYLMNNIVEQVLL